MTVKQAAAKLDVSASLIYGLCRLGVIKVTRHGRPGKRGTVRISEEALEEYRDSCRAVAAPASLRHIR